MKLKKERLRDVTLIVAGVEMGDDGEPYATSLIWRGDLVATAEGVQDFARWVSNASQVVEWSRHED